MTVRKKMTIELKSDLCIASGYAYAGSIDSDICYDEWGIPYIPGRRLKGCLRETAETEMRALIEGDCMDRIFGQSRADGTKGIVIEDAFPRGYGEMVKALKKIRKSSDKELKEILTQQRVLEEFSTVKAQTALDEDGVADDQTLRYTRTVNQYISDVEKMVFETSVSYDLNEAEKKILGYIVSATKHIGLYRNRGLGNVKCRLDDGYDETDKTISEDIQDPETVEASGEEEWIIKYSLRNVQPLMLSNMEDDTSETRIRGQSVLGLLAAKYLQCGTNSADSEEFKDLFLNGNTCYSDLVIVRNGKPYYPAPLFLRKLKKSCKYVNAAFEYEASDFSGQEKKDYSSEGGNQPKKLNGKYVYISPDGKIDVAEVEKKIVYHHSHKGSNRYKEAILYTNEVIAEGQTFMGSIRLSGKYAKKMMNLLINSDLRIGKSKTAQYGKCELAALKAENLKPGNTDEQMSTEQENSCYVQKEAGDLIAVIFLSDAFILYRDERSDGGARYTIFRDEVIEQVGKELTNAGICCNELKPDPVSKEMTAAGNNGSLRQTAYIETTDISGYNTTLNLRKQTLHAVKAGSVIFYELCKPTSIVEGYIGEKQHEGYGHFMIVPVRSMQYKVEKLQVKESEDPLQSEDVQPVFHIVERAVTDMLVDDIRLQAIRDAENNQSSLRGLTASNIGRVTLMLRESLSESPLDKESAFENFYARVEAIKKTEERKILRRTLLSKIADSEVKNEDGSSVTKWDLSPKKVRDLLKEFEKDRELFDRLKEHYKWANADGKLVGLWNEYVMTALVYSKYQLAER